MGTDTEPQDALTARDVIAMLLAAALPDFATPVALAEGLLDQLGHQGFTILPTEEWETLVEIKAGAEGRFPRGLVIKPGREADFYICWSNVCEAPSLGGTRAEMLAEGCPESRLRRADETGTSAKRDPMSSYSGPLDGGWDDEGFVAEQRGWLPRARLGAYVRAYMDGRMDEAFDQLEPFEGETEVRRDH